MSIQAGTKKISFSDYFRMDRRSAPWLVCAGLLLAAVVLFFRETVRAAVAETDLCWMIPTVFKVTEGLSLPQAIGILLSPVPFKLELPFLKAVLYFPLVCGNGTTSGLLVAGILLHLLNAFGVGLLARWLGLGRRVGILSGLLFASALAPFHAVFWPTAMACHSLSLFWMLLVVLLYLETERRVSERRPHRAVGWAALAAALAASLARGTQILPLILMGHLLLAARSREERMQRYRRWFRLLLAWTIYPAWFFSRAPEHFTNVLLHRLTAAMATWQTGPWLTAALLWSGIALPILALWVVLRMWPKRLSAGKLTIFSIAVLWVLLAWVDRREILFPYNASVPWLTVQGSFLSPFETAMKIRSASAYQFLPPQIDWFSAVLAVFIIAVAWKTCLRGLPDSCLLGLWYAAPLLHFLFQYSSQPVVAPSRHFIYVTPVFSIVFSVFCVKVWEGLRDVWSLKKLPAEFLLASAVSLLCLTNLAGIRVALWRTQLANNFYTYDDTRTASTVVSVLERTGFAEAAVRGVVPMPFDKSYWPLVPDDPKNQRLFRYIARQVAPPGMEIWPIEQRTAARLFYADGLRLEDEDRRVVGSFDRLFEAGQSAFRKGRTAEAADRFREAIRERPFLFQYLLGRTQRLSDLRWMTGGTGVRFWMREMFRIWNGERPVPTRKQQRTEQVLEREVGDLGLCLAYLAFLEHHEGRPEMSRFWLSMLQVLEEDPRALSLWISREVSIEASPAFTQFCAQELQQSGRGERFLLHKDDYRFGRFLFRLLAGWDLPSRWDRAHPDGLVREMNKR